MRISIEGKIVDVPDNLTEEQLQDVARMVLSDDKSTEAIATPGRTTQRPPPSPSGPSLPSVLGNIPEELERASIEKVGGGVERAAQAFDTPALQDAVRTVGNIGAFPIRALLETPRGVERAVEKPGEFAKETGQALLQLLGRPAQTIRTANPFRLPIEGIPALLETGSPKAALEKATAPLPGSAQADTDFKRKPLSSLLGLAEPALLAAPGITGVTRGVTRGARATATQPELPVVGARATPQGVVAPLRGGPRIQSAGRPRTLQRAEVPGTKRTLQQKAASAESIEQKFGSFIDDAEQGTLTQEQAAQRIIDIENNLADETLSLRPKDTAQQTGFAVQNPEQIAPQLRQIQQGTKRLTGELVELAIRQGKRVGEEGTVTPGFGTQFRAARGIDDVYDIQVSERILQETKASVNAQAQELSNLRKEIASQGDLVGAGLTRRYEQLLKIYASNFDQFFRFRRASGKLLQSFQQPTTALSKEAIEIAQSIGRQVDNMSGVRQRLPILNETLELVKEGVKQRRLPVGRVGDITGRYLVANMFTLTSPTLDMLGTLGRLAGQLGADTAQTGLQAITLGKKGRPGLQSTLRAAGNRLSARGRVQETIEGEFIRTAAGIELSGQRNILLGPRRGAGARERTVVDLIDFALVPGARLKTAVDTAAKRFVATKTVIEDALQIARQRKLGTADTRALVRDFLNDAPEATVQRAIAEGRRLGFRQELPGAFTKFAQNGIVRSFINPFAMWGGQLSSWLLEMAGTPVLTNTVRAMRGTGSIEEVVSSLGRAATGWGGFTLVDRVLYDNVDFHNMRYVDPETGDGFSLRGLDPVPSILMMNALARGVEDPERHLPKAFAGFENSGLPLSSLFGTRERGGLVGGFVQEVAQFLNDPTRSSRKVENEMGRVMNLFVPGRPLFMAMNSFFDPVRRRGAMANIPGFSESAAPIIDPTTGKPVVNRLSVFGTDITFTRFGGIIPGTEGVRTEVRNLYDTIGLPPWQMKSNLKLFGKRPSELSQEERDQFFTVLGHLRAQHMPIYAANATSMREESPRFRGLFETIVKENDALLQLTAAELLNAAGGFDTQALVIPRESRAERLRPEALRSNKRDRVIDREIERKFVDPPFGRARKDISDAFGGTPRNPSMTGSMTPDQALSLINQIVTQDTND